MFKRSATGSNSKMLRSLSYFCNDNSENFKSIVNNCIPKEFKCDPKEMFNLMIDVCSSTGRIVDSSTIQSYSVYSML